MIIEKPKIGDTVYIPLVLQGHEGSKEILERKVVTGTNGRSLRLDDGQGMVTTGYSYRHVGNLVFLSRKKAELAIKDSTNYAKP